MARATEAAQELEEQIAIKNAEIRKLKNDARNMDSKLTETDELKAARS